MAFFRYPDLDEYWIIARRKERLEDLAAKHTEKKIIAIDIFPLLHPHLIEYCFLHTSESGKSPAQRFFYVIKDQYKAVDPLA